MQKITESTIITITIAVMTIAVMTIALATTSFFFGRHLENKEQKSPVHAIEVIVDNHEYTVFLDEQNNSVIIHNKNCKKCQEKL